MNPFLNLLDTVDKTIDVSLSLCPVTCNNFLYLDVLVNDNIIFSGEIDNKKTLRTSVKLDEQIHLKIILKKILKNNDAVTIQSIKIDDFEIIPNYIHYSDYIGLDGTAFGPTEYLGVSGKWNLNINKPFYHWKHEATGMGWLLYP